MSPRPGHHASRSRQKSSLRNHEGARVLETGPHTPLMTTVRVPNVSCSLSARRQELGAENTQHAPSSSRITRCYPPCTTGSPKGLIPRTCTRRRRYWRSEPEADVRSGQVWMQDLLTDCARHQSSRSVSLWGRDCILARSGDRLFAPSPPADR